MVGLAYSQHGLSIAAGAIIGLAAFAPLLLVLVPVLRRERDASMLTGFACVFASFMTLLLGAVAAYVLLRSAFMEFVAAELVGFLASSAVVAIVVMVRRD